MLTSCMQGVFQYRGQGMKNAKILQNCKQGAEQRVVMFQGKLHIGAYLNLFHAVTCK